VFFLLIILEKIHQTIIALFGSLLIMCFGVLNQEGAIQHIDFNMFGLLIGMIIVNIKASTGLLGYIAIWSA
jgi:Na+/H+ antiporter NhaD/arsenite permease-like protein